MKIEKNTKKREKVSLPQDGGTQPQVPIYQGIRHARLQRAPRRSMKIKTPTSVRGELVEP